MSIVAKRILFAATTTGLPLAGVGPIGNLSLVISVFAKSGHEGSASVGKAKAGHDQGDAGKDKGSHDKGPSADADSADAGGSGDNGTSGDSAGDR